MGADSITQRRQPRSVFDTDGRHRDDARAAIAASRIAAAGMASHGVVLPEYTKATLNKSILDMFSGRKPEPSAGLLTPKQSLA